MRVPASSNPLWPALVLAGLVLGLALFGFGGTDITQIMSNFTALVAMYVVKQAPNDSM
ncbi:hypothetical protein PS9374_05930 [Planomonospora sphaerica]|uniref:Uncharacterized protein n=1 Tax=Planomonospora sphaerica TaxID=161355 RepID=A0A171DMM6_9ACTN|nr:hypothetical protein PS9374_05930 [Planomonospora sphaerica]